MCWSQIFSLDVANGDDAFVLAAHGLDQQQYGSSLEPYSHLSFQLQGKFQGFDTRELVSVIGAVFLLVDGCQLFVREYQQIYKLSWARSKYCNTLSYSEKDSHSLLTL